MAESTQSRWLIISARILRAFSESKARTGEPISPEVHAQMAELCESLVNGLGEMESKRDGLEKLENQLAESLAGELPSNVVAFRRKIPTPAYGASGRDKLYNLKSDCLIEAQHVVETHKMAMELHSNSDRLAFVDFTSLNVKQRQSLSQLLGLGQITLFVPDIRMLISYEQEIFRHLIGHDPLRRPLLMVGSVQPYADLQGQPGIDEQLLTLLARSYIKLTRPFSEYKEQGLIHYFLDSLSANPT